MIRSLILGAVCLTCSALAQQYISEGPVPERPAYFPGASIAQSTQQGGRATIRQRPTARSFQQEPATPSRVSPPAQAQPVRLRRPQSPQSAARARANVIDEESPQIAKQRIGISSPDDVYLRPRVAAPTPQPTPQPAPQTTRLLASRPVAPVVEDEYIEEDDDEVTTPASISRAGYVGQFQPSQQSPTPFQRPAFLQPTSFRPGPQLPVQQPPILPTPQPPIVRQFPRPQPPPRPIPQALPTPISRPPPQPTPLSQSDEEEDDEPQYQRQQPVRQQPKRPAPQQYEPAAQAPRPSQPLKQQTVRQQDVYRPHPSKASSNTQREKKPVAQIVRKYQNENEDGSITWGYENDDGSFKEETIGYDCVTRGKYGYYDPDGVKREYSYQTGIPCDKEAEAEQAASANEGYVDYSSNKYVFPNGDEIDLEAMIKNKKRKVVGKYRN